MKSLTKSECVEWLTANGLDGTYSNGWPMMGGDYLLTFDSPREGRMQWIVARDLMKWVSDFEAALLWITDWPFYKPDEMAVVTRLRRSYGEGRILLNAPGNLFQKSEIDELVGWVALMLCFGWDSYLFTSPPCGRMFQTSHEDFLHLGCHYPQCLNEAKLLCQRRGLLLRREESQQDESGGEEEGVAH